MTLPVDSNPTAPPCARCGQRPSAWILTMGMTSHERMPGRLLTRCRECLRDDLSTDFGAERVGLVVSWDLAAADPDQVMAALYADGFTESSPDTAADVVGLPGAWIGQAKQILADRYPQD